MKRKFAALQHIAHDHRITAETDSAFWYHIQNALLLALKEQGRLNPIQYRQAEERLNRKQRDRARNR